MPFYQCDASGLVKRYADEVGSAWVRAIVDSASANIISITDITRAEVISAFARRACSAPVESGHKAEKTSVGIVTTPMVC